MGVFEEAVIRGQTARAESEAKTAAEQARIGRFREDALGLARRHWSVFEQIGVDAVAAL